MTRCPQCFSTSRSNLYSCGDYYSCGERSPTCSVFSKGSRSQPAERITSMRSPCQLSYQAKEEMIWWKEETNSWNGPSIRTPDLKRSQLFVTTFTDASDTGWGVKSEILLVAGHWTEEEKRDSIKVRELKAILFATKTPQETRKRQGDPPVYGQHHCIQICPETGGGGTSSIMLQRLALEIHEIHELLLDCLCNILSDMSYSNSMHLLLPSSHCQHNSRLQIFLHPDFFFFCISYSCAKKNHHCPSANPSGCSQIPK